MKDSEILEVLTDVEFHYPGDFRYRYCIPGGLTLATDETWCIYGVSGSGKSTLMTLLAALRRLRQGRIRYRFGSDPPVDVGAEVWDDRVGPALWSRVGFAFQRPEMIRALSVRDNLHLVLKPDKIADCPLFSSKEWDSIASSPVHQISGGQVQRLGLMRAFGEGQELVFLDEPTNNLDRSNRDSVATFVQQERHGRALVLVSHDEDFIAGLDVDRLFQIEEEADLEAGLVRRVLRCVKPTSLSSQQTEIPIKALTAQPVGA